MSLIDRLQGALTALITPFTADGAVDIKRFRALVAGQIERGIDGLVPCGTTGETPTLSLDEQERVVRAAVEVAEGRVPVIAGTGHFDTKTAIAQTKNAKAWGIDAALVVTPYYNKPNQEGMFQHYRAIHEETGVPVVVYNVPGRTASDILPETLARLVEIGAAIGVKDATANMTRTAETLATIGRETPFAMLSGDDFTILPFVACGGKGVVSVVSNLLPGDTSRLVKLTAKGELDAANPLNDRIIRLSRALFLEPNPIPVKAGMAMAGWCESVVRLPLVPATPEIQSTVQAAINLYRSQPALTSIEGFMS